MTALTKQLQNIKLFLLDMDGTVYLSGRMIEGADKAIEHIKKTDRRVCFLTNNSSQDNKAYTDKLNNMGINVSSEDIYTSGQSCIDYLKIVSPQKKVYLFANPIVKKEFLNSGINLCEENPDIVVVAFNTSFEYSELDKLCRFIRKGVTFYATHADLNCPLSGGDGSVDYMPDVGSFLALIEKSTNRLPDLILGKPHKALVDNLIKKFDIRDNSSVCMVGDRLNTDIMFAKNFGFTSVLVLTGGTSKEMLQAHDTKPDIVLDSISDLRGIL